MQTFTHRVKPETPLAYALNARSSGVYVKHVQPSFKHNTQQLNSLSCMQSVGSVLFRFFLFGSETVKGRLWTTVLPSIR